MTFTFLFGRDNYVPVKPSPANSSLIIPVDKQVKLSWNCPNPYKKTVTYTVNLLINGTEKIIYDNLKSELVNIEVESGDEVEWTVTSKVYEKNYHGPTWKFNIPEESVRTYEASNITSFVDVVLSDNTFKITANQIIEGKYNPKIITIASNGDLLEERDIQWNDFFANLIVNNKLIGHIFDKNGYKLAAYNLTTNSTSLINNEYFSSVQEIKDVNTGFLVTGISNKQSKILLLDNSLQLTDTFFSNVIAYSSDYLDDYLLVAGKKKIGDIYVPSISFKKDEEQWVCLSMEIAGAFTHCEIKNDGFYVLGQISSSYECRQDLIVRKYDFSGNLLWSNFIDNYGDDIPGELIIKDNMLEVLGTYYAENSYSSYIVNYGLDGETAGVSFYETDTNELPAKLIHTEIGSFLFGIFENNYKRKIFMRFIGN
ncbi:MAG: hypothetical protein ACOC5T_02890 [Elusimicrobiota bacterium]